MPMETVWHGYSTFLDQKQRQELVNMGVNYVWAGVRNLEALVNIIKTGGLASTKERAMLGTNSMGASSAEDVRTGGADSVFCRWGKKFGKYKPESFSYSYLGDKYRIIIKDDVLARTDWYTYGFDNYGHTRYDTVYQHTAFSERLTAKETILQLDNCYNAGNEIMFRQGIGSDMFKAIYTPDNHYKNKLLSALKSEGITEINGIPIDKFVIVENRVGF